MKWYLEERQKVDLTFEELEIGDYFIEPGEQVVYRKVWNDFGCLIAIYGDGDYHSMDYQDLVIKVEPFKFENGVLWFRRV